jgi:hypothetical protein
MFSMPSALPEYLDIELALSQIGDVEGMHGMLLMLQEALLRDVPLVASLLQAGDVAAANRVLHALKGFIPIFCQDKLCAHVVRVELLSKDSQSQAVGPAYAVLQPELEQLLREVQDYLQVNVA